MIGPRLLRNWELEQPSRSLMLCASLGALGQEQWSVERAAGNLPAVESHGPAFHPLGTVRWPFSSWSWMSKVAVPKHQNVKINPLKCKWNTQGLSNSCNPVPKDMLSLSCTGWAFPPRLCQLITSLWFFQVIVKWSFRTKLEWAPTCLFSCEYFPPLNITPMSPDYTNMQNEGQNWCEKYMSVYAD